MSFKPISEADIDQLLARVNAGESDPSRHLALDAARRNALVNFDDIQACPGSGKTTLVGLKLQLLLEQWHDAYSGICVLTHSNVAISEIVARLGTGFIGTKLLSYPHFIGTIQEFVNSFLALPYARSRDWDVHLVDAAEFGSFVESAKDWNFQVHDREANKPYWFSSYFRQKTIKPEIFQLEHRDGELKASAAFIERVHALIDFEKSKIDEDRFHKIRRDLCKRGLFTYSEMYQLARQAITSNKDLLQALRARFKVTILDEMQDTQKQQDDLLNLLFPSDECTIQRFGDPDQSIFDQIGGGLPNTSYNDASLRCITESHRFVPSIATTLAGLSYRKAGPFTGSRTVPPGCPKNTIFLFEDPSIGRILPSFAKLVRNLPVEHRSTVKAVGGIGKITGASSLALANYWPAYDAKPQPQSFRAKSLCDAVRFCGRLREGDVAVRYQILITAVVEWMRRAGRQYTARSGRMIAFNRATLTAYLKESDKALDFGAVMISFITGDVPTQEIWSQTISELSELLELGQLSGRAEAFAAYEESEDKGSSGDNEKRDLNVYDDGEGVRIKLATIHSVKGETHDATLVCETKYQHWFDIREMAEFLCDPDAARPIADYTQPKSKETNRTAFMKRLFVAMSRPRYLLCLAVKKSHLTTDQLERLIKVGGWVVEDLTAQT